jgi:Lrp/AsnC family leucine-responsive transcriptional regulator
VFGGLHFGRHADGLDYWCSHGLHGAPIVTLVCGAFLWKNVGMDVQSSGIDAIDARILGEMRHDARISWRELGDRVHLAPTSVADRVKRLEQQGVITGYEARIDAAALGRTVQAIVDVSLVPGDGADAFEERIAARDEVVFAAYVTGSADYKIIVECAGAPGLDAFIRWVRADEVVARTESQLILRTILD